MIAIDKKLHMAAGALVGAAVVFGLTKYGFATREQRVLVAALAAFAVGVAKEIYDKFTPGHTVDSLDAAATGGGGVLGAVAATFLIPLLT